MYIIIICNILKIVLLLDFYATKSCGLLARILEHDYVVISLVIYYALAYVASLDIKEIFYQFYVYDIMIFSKLMWL